MDVILSFCTCQACSEVCEKMSSLWMCYTQICPRFECLDEHIIHTCVYCVLALNAGTGRGVCVCVCVYKCCTNVAVMATHRSILCSEGLAAQRAWIMLTIYRPFLLAHTCEEYVNITTPSIDHHVSELVWLFPIFLECWLSAIISFKINLIYSFCNARHINPLGSQGAAVWQPQRTHR